MTKTEKINIFVQEYPQEQIKSLLVELIEYSIDSELVGIGDYGLYWKNTGEPLVEGFESFKDED